MANLLLALVTAELSLFGVDAAPALAPAANSVPVGTAPSFDNKHYRSALG